MTKARRRKAGQRMVEVEWADAATQHGWGDPAEHAARPVPMCRTLGYLIRSDRSGVYVSGTICTNDNGVADTTRIPRGMVLRVRRVR